MADSMPVLVAPAALGPGLRAPAVAAAIGRGLERAGLAPPDLCPVAGGGRGTLEVLLPALGGETAGARVLDFRGHEIVVGFALVDGGATALVEAAQIDGASSYGIGQVVAAAIDAGASVVVLACGDAAAEDEGAGAIAAIEQRGGLRGGALVALHDARAAGRLASALSAQLGARLVSGPAFVLEELGFDARMRSARAVVVGAPRLDASTLDGRVSGEIAIRARQSGIPCHSIAALNALAPFDARILDLQAILEAATIAALEDAGERLAQAL